MTATKLRFSAILLGLLIAAAGARADQPGDQIMNASPDQVRAAMQRLPPEVQNRIREELRTKSPEELMRMTPDQLRAEIDSLSPQTKAQLKAQWAALSDDQKAALKSMNLKALVRQLVARFAAMGPTERAIVRKIFGEAVGVEQ